MFFTWNISCLFSFRDYILILNLLLHVYIYVCFPFWAWIYNRFSVFSPKTCSITISISRSTCASTITLSLNVTLSLTLRQTFAVSLASHVVFFCGLFFFSLCEHLCVYVTHIMYVQWQSVSYHGDFWSTSHHQGHRSHRQLVCVLVTVWNLLVSAINKPYFCHIPRLALLILLSSLYSPHFFDLFLCKNCCFLFYVNLESLSFPLVVSFFSLSYSLSHCLRHFLAHILILSKTCQYFDLPHVAIGWSNGKRLDVNFGERFVALRVDGRGWSRGFGVATVILTFGTSYRRLRRRQLSSSKFWRWSSRRFFFVKDRIQQRFADWGRREGGYFVKDRNPAAACVGGHGGPRLWPLQLQVSAQLVSRPDWPLPVFWFVVSLRRTIWRLCWRRWWWGRGVWSWKSLRWFQGPEDFDGHGSFSVLCYLVHWKNQVLVRGRTSLWTVLKVFQCLVRPRGSGIDVMKNKLVNILETGAMSGTAALM